MIVWLLVNELFTLFFGAFVGYAQIPAEFGVNFIHYLPENLSVCRGVFELVKSDIVVYHLMDDDVFHLTFGQVQSGVDTKFEIILLYTAIWLSACTIYTLSQECLGIAQYNGNIWQFSTKNLTIELIKFFLYKESCSTVLL